MMQVDRYLQRIGYHGPRKATGNVLQALQVAHLRTVPFENFSIHRREPIHLSEGRLFDKIVRGRRGGFCYELNGLFAALLRALGFEVDLLSARVPREDGTYTPEFDHLALLVQPAPSASGAPYLADVGFGEAFLRPLRLAQGLVQKQGTTSFVLEEEGGVWTLLERTCQEPFAPVYRFTLRSYELADFADRCRFHQHSPESHFAKKTVCTLATPKGRITLSGNRLITTEDGRRREHELTAPEYPDALKCYFGLAL